MIVTGILLGCYMLRKWDTDLRPSDSQVHYHAWNLIILLVNHLQWYKITGQFCNGMKVLVFVFTFLAWQHLSSLNLLCPLVIFLFVALHFLFKTWIFFFSSHILIVLEIWMTVHEIIVECMPLSISFLPLWSFFSKIFFLLNFLFGCSLFLHDFVISYFDITA